MTTKEQDAGKQKTTWEKTARLNLEREIHGESPRAAGLRIIPQTGGALE
jgi:hypothetical protein